MSFVTVFSGSDATNAALKHLVAIARGGAVGKSLRLEALAEARLLAGLGTAG